MVQLSAVYSINDYFGLNYWGPISELSFFIYNRWGERVFYTNNPRDCWNGSYKGVLQPSRAFDYLVDSNFNAYELMKNLDLAKLNG